MMTPRDWTALGLRLIGVYYMLAALSNFTEVIGDKMDWWDRSSGLQHFFLLRAAIYAVVGLALARKAEGLASFLIGAKPGPPSGPDLNETTADAAR